MLQTMLLQIELDFYNHLACLSAAFAAERQAK